MPQESYSFTRVLHSIHVAKLYCEDMINEMPALKRKVDSWIAKLSYVTTDALYIMDETSRESYRNEIRKGDPLLFEHVFQLLCDMTPEQRAKVETFAESLGKQELELTQ